MADGRCRYCVSVSPSDPTLHRCKTGGVQFMRLICTWRKLRVHNHCGIKTGPGAPKACRFINSCKSNYMDCATRCAVEESGFDSL